MAKHYQKALFFGVKNYSLFNSFIEILENLADEVRGFDIRDMIKAREQKIHSQIYRFPFKIRKFWEKYFLLKTNKIILQEVNSFNPDIVFIYNSEFLLPETCEKIKKNSKLIFFMGDSPFFTHTNHFYLPCLFYADLILSPDTFWISQLNTLGLRQTAYFVPGIDHKSYYPIEDRNKLTGVLKSEVFYAGVSYKNSWGYKKALFMSKFSNFDLKIFGNNAWKRWFGFFPELERSYTESGYIPTEKLNLIFNNTKIIPVDGNPAILNGFHIRIFEAIGAGILPLAEYRKDLSELLFKDINIKIPLVTDYNKAQDLAKYYLINDNEREQTVSALKEFINKEYNVVRNADLIIDYLKK